MTFNQMRAAAEAILFAAGEPVETAKIAQALDIEIEDAETVLRSCAEQLDLPACDHFTQQRHILRIMFEQKIQQPA